ncbi:PAS domain S-box protein [Thioalkalivibrio halophilus]|uniref:PAS domain S-box protein n=1 Tax=Thioalkalivibrio halophilus TaxID=252474 RepID=A0A1V2ZXV1_9GAMM|nr:PAS domain S-box protein [Thioalkalivibrio halophilus]OOC09886.1 PAS domain S-box protein [Thioalkalivibrio halophilus]
MPPRASEPPRPEDSPRLSVLLVEDNMGDAALVRDLLAIPTGATRFDTTHCGRLQEAREHLARDAAAFDAILLDLNLPDSDPDETLQRVLSTTREIPVVVLTGDDHAATGAHAIEAGAEDFLSKNRLGEDLLQRSLVYAVTRHRARRELAQQEALYRSLVEDHPHLVTRYLPDTTLLHANRSMLEHLGRTSEELLGQRWLDWTPEADAGRVRAHLESFTPERPVGHFENTLPRADGELRTIMWSNRAFFDADGRITAFQGVGIDVTEQREAERGRERLIQILEATPDFVSMADAEGNILYVNRGGKELIGLPGAEGGADPEQDRTFFSGERAGEWLAPEWARERLAAEGLPTARRTGFWEGESALLHVDGHEIPVSQRIIAHFDDDGEPEYYSTIIRDIRPEKTREALEQRRQNALQDLHRITSTADTEDAGKLRALLELGLREFAMNHGRLVRVDDGSRRILEAAGEWPEGAGEPGDRDANFCDNALTETGPVGFHAPEARETGCSISESPEARACLGMPVYVNDELRAVLSFVARRPREPFVPFERDLINLMAQWIGHELTRREQRLALERERNLFMAGPTLIFAWDNAPGWPIQYVSPNVREILGYDPQELAGERTPHNDLVHPDDRERVDREVQAHTDDRSANFQHTPYRMRHRDGGWRWMLDFTTIERDEFGAVDHYHGYLVDITERRELEEELELLAATFRASHAIFITDADGRILRANPAFEEITGYSAAESIGANPRELLKSGAHGRTFYLDLFNRLDEQGHWEGEIWDRRKDGVLIPLYMSITALRSGDDGPVEHYVAVFHDISRQKHLEAELERQALHDRLTGVPNRRHLESLLEQEASRSDRHGESFSVLLLDLDRFKAVNDTFGHDVGDEVLQTLVRVLQERLRKSDVVGRWGGEEFMILLPATDLQHARKVAETLRSRVGKAVFPGPGHITVSIGVSEYQPGEPLKDTFKRADDALYEAKRRGRNRVAAHE